MRSKDLPQRIRSHELEMLSRGKFSQLVGEQHWVLREIQGPDYGVDDSVEIFREGKTTGLNFFVQAKSSDSSQLSTTLKVTTINYFEQLSDPVLIVFFSAPLGKLFGKWFHRCQFQSNNKKFTVNFSAADELNSLTMTEVYREVALRRQLSSVQLNSPLLIKVENDSALPTESLVLTLQTRVGFTGRLLFTATPTSEVFGLVARSAEGIRVDIGRIAGTIPLSLEGVVRNEVDIALMALAVELDAFGHSALACELLSLIPVSAAAWQFWSEPGDAARLVLCNRGSLSDILSHVRQLKISGELFMASLTIGLLWKNGGRSLTNTDTEILDVFYKELVDAALNAGDDESAGMLSYNRANFLLNTGRDFGSSYDAYASAARLRPEYLSTDYFIKEFAHASFEVERYGQAEDLYRNALSQEHDAHVVACLADTLLRQGKFTASAELFEQYLEQVDSPRSCWVTRYVAALRAARVLGDQVRNQQGGQQLWNRLTGVGEMPTKEQILDVLRLDGLHPLGWRTLGIHSLNEPEVCYLDFLVSAISSNLESTWALSFGYACCAGAVIAPAILAEGAQHDPELFVTELLQLNEYFDFSGTSAEGFLRAIEAASNGSTNAVNVRPLAAPEGSAED